MSYQSKDYICITLIERDMRYTVKNFSDKYGNLSIEAHYRLEKFEMFDGRMRDCFVIYKIYYKDRDITNLVQYSDSNLGTDHFGYLQDSI